MGKCAVQDRIENRNLQHKSLKTVTEDLPKTGRDGIHSSTSVLLIF